MPVFFLVGGYVHAQSWTDHHARRESWAWWVRDRFMRLWWPTAVFVVAGILVVVGARAAGADPGEVDEAGWLAALQLWFLPVYLLLITLTPVMLAAHRRWGLAVPRRDGCGSRPGERRRDQPAPAHGRVRQLPAGVGLDLPVGPRLGRRHT